MRALAISGPLKIISRKPHDFPATKAMALSRYHIRQDGALREPSFRSAPDLDFFRGEEGSKYRPDVFDDGDLDTASPKTLKAFLDVMMEESMTRERWGAAKFVRGQAIGFIKS